MKNNRYALVVENEVFEIISVPFTAPALEDIHTGFMNSPVGKNITSFPDSFIGWEWNGNTFIPGTEYPDSQTYFERTGVEYPLDSEVYAFLSNNKIFFLIFAPNGKTKSEMYKAAFDANPTAIYLSEEHDNVSIGDIWNGTSFSKVIGV